MKIQGQVKEGHDNINICQRAILDGEEDSDGVGPIAIVANVDGKENNVRVVVR